MKSATDSEAAGAATPTASEPDKTNGEVNPPEFVTSMEDAGDGDKPNPEPPTAESARSTVPPAAQQVNGQGVEEVKTLPSDHGPRSPSEPSGVAQKEDAKPITNVVEQVPVDELSPHPLNEKIYGPSDLEGLVASVGDGGITSALTARWVDGKRQLIGGHRRREAAKLAGLTHVPVLMVEVKDERTGAQRLVQDNVGAREKTNEERIREYAILKPTEAAAAKTRQQAAGKQEGKNPAPPPADAAGKAGDIAAKKVGKSRPWAEDGLKVVAAIDELTAKGQPEKANGLRALLNKSTDGALKSAMAAGYLPKPEAKGSKPRTAKENPANAAAPPAGQSTAASNPPTEPKNPPPASLPPSSNPIRLPAAGAATGPQTTGNVKVVHSDALDKAYEIEEFLRTQSATTLTDKAKADWRNVAMGIIGRLKNLGLSFPNF